MAIELTTASPGTISAIRATLSAADKDFQTAYASTSALVIVDGGNTRTQNVSIGTNDAYHLRIKTNNTSSRITILSSGEVGIGTALASTRAVQLTGLSNGDFSNTTGMAFNGTDWYGGTVPFWTRPGSDGVFDVNFSGGGYKLNLFAGVTGPGSSAARQNLGVLPTLTDVTVNFTNAFVGFGDATLSAAIFTDTFAALVSSNFDANGNYSITAPNVPAGTNIIIGFWGKAGLTNVVATANNNTILTTIGGVSASSIVSAKMQIRGGNLVLTNLPTSKVGLPSGTIWNNGGVLNIV